MGGPVEKDDEGRGEGRLPCDLPDAEWFDVDMTAGFEVVVRLLAVAVTLVVAFGLLLWVL